MKVTITGSGTGMPSLQRASPSVLVQVREITLLLDSGPGTMRQILKAGVSFLDLDYLLYTHFHPDHTLDFMALFFALKNPDLPPPPRPLTIVAPRGFRKLHQELKKGYGTWIEPPRERVEILELPLESSSLGLREGLVLRSYPMSHTSSSLGYRIQEPGGTQVAYSGDTDFCPNAVELGRGTHLLILECSFPEGQKHPGHLIPSLAGKIAQQAGTRKLVLTHFYPQCEGADLLGPCRKFYHGPVILARDLMTIEV